MTAQACADRAVRDLEALLAQTFRAHQQEAVTYCAAILGNRELADDAVQAAFATLLRRIRTGDAAFFTASPWEAVKRNLRWAALKQQRERMTVERWLEEVESASPSRDRSSEVEHRLVVHGILGRLPDHMVQVLRLRFFEDQPDALSAAELGITLDAFRCRCKRALHAARGVAQSLGVEQLACALAAVNRRGQERLRRAWLSTGRRTADAVDRLGGAAQAPSLAVLRGPVEMLMIATAVVSVSTPALSPLAPTAAPAMPRTAAMAATAGQPSAAPVADGGMRRRHVEPLAPVASAPPALPLSAPVGTAADETPEDTHLYTVTGGSGSRGSDTLVALGWGMRCSCSVVFQSSDGGTRWQAANGPQLDMGAANQVLLPPAYPADPRIFVSTPNSPNSVAYESARFGAPFTPMPVPAGSMTLSPGFDRGDDRIFVAAGGTAWAYSLASQASRPVLLGAGAATVDAVASPAEPGPDVLFAVAETPTLQNAGLSSLYACTSAMSCRVIATLPHARESRILISPAFNEDHTIVLTWTNHLLVSQDGGLSFTDHPLPSDADILSSAALTASGPAGLSVWVLGGHDTTTRILLRFDIASGAWQTSLSQASGRTPYDIDVTASWVVVPLAEGGLACSRLAAPAWGARCA